MLRSYKTQTVYRSTWFLKNKFRLKNFFFKSKKIYWRVLASFGAFCPDNEYIILNVGWRVAATKVKKYFLEICYMTHIGQ